MPFAEITDGTSHTFLLGEDAGRPQFWTKAGLQSGDDYPNNNNSPVIAGVTKGSAWADPASECPVNGFTGDGMQGGPYVLNVTNNSELFAFHPGGINTVFCDGSVHYLAETVDGPIVCALVTRAGGEKIGYNF